MLTKQQYDASDDDGDGTELDADLRETRLASFCACRTAAPGHTLADIAVVGVDTPTAVARITQFNALVDWLTRHRPATVIVAYQPPTVRAPGTKLEVSYSAKMTTEACCRRCCGCTSPDFDELLLFWQTAKCLCTHLCITRKFCQTGKFNEIPNIQKLIYPKLFYFDEIELRGVIFNTSTMNHSECNSTTRRLLLKLLKVLCKPQ